MQRTRSTTRLGTIRALVLIFACVYSILATHAAGRRVGGSLSPQIAGRSLAMFPLLRASRWNTSGTATNVCGLHWTYCPRDPGCEGYSMSVHRVDFHVADRARPINATDLPPGARALAVVRGLTTLDAVPQHGSYKVYTLSGTESEGGALNDVLVLDGGDAVDDDVLSAQQGLPSDDDDDLDDDAWRHHGAAGRSPTAQAGYQDDDTMDDAVNRHNHHVLPAHHFTMVIPIGVESEMLSADWFEFGIDVFTEPSSTHEAMCIEVGNTQWLSDRIRQDHPPFVTYCRDLGNGTFVEDTVPIADGASLERSMLKTTAVSTAASALELGRDVFGEVVNDNHFPYSPDQTNISFDASDVADMDGASRPVLAFLGAIDTFITSFFDTFGASLAGVFAKASRTNVTIHGSLFDAALCDTFDSVTSSMSAAVAPVEKALSTASGPSSAGQDLFLFGGGGAGFGFQFACEEKVILSMGMGGGFGLQLHAKPRNGNERLDISWAAHIGGGGGLQAQSLGGVPLTEVGGGGSGTFSYDFGSGGVPTNKVCNATEDSGEFGEVPVQRLVRYLREQCGEHPISFVGGGGGGSGVAVGGDEQWCEEDVGGGWGYYFGDTNAVYGQNGETNHGLAVSEAFRACVADCHDARGAARASVYESCMCPCQRQRLRAAGIPWADGIQCGTT